MLNEAKQKGRKSTKYKEELRKKTIQQRKTSTKGQAEKNKS